MNTFVDSARSFKTQFDLNFSEKIIVDFFAGGGGASTGLEMGLNRPVHVAVNHNPKAISMHEANHPHAKHYVQDVFAVDPIEICDGYQVGWFHASPDCTHHSQAAGGQPRKKEIRDLSWVVLKFAGKVKPDVISLENVEQILNWGPLIAKRDKATGRVITLEKIEVHGKKVHRVAEPGEHVPRDNQFLVPDPRKKGKTWRHFVRSLQRLGYVVEWKKIIAADYSAPTIRKRLFMVARCDGQAIVWPEATHAKKPKRGQKKWREAAECIDFSDLGNSIFERPKPLVDATLRRVARGMKKLVLDAKKPYIVKNAVPFIGRDFNTGFGHAINEPLGTTTAGYGGHSSLISPIIAPFLTEFANASHQRNWGIFEPLTTICAQVKGGHHALVAPMLVHIGHGEGTPDSPRWSQGFDCISQPLGTVTASGAQRNLVTAELSKGNMAGALRVAAFLINYYGNGDARDISAPIDTLTTKDRLALVTVWVKGEPWVIVDIKMRMLYPRELYIAQGFPQSYIIDRGHDGKPLTKTEQVHMCGNSVSPEPMAAIARANNPFITQLMKGAA